MFIKDPETVLNNLEKSDFRKSFILKGKELSYLREKGLSIIMEHAKDILDKRIAPVNIENDGKQTPMKNHPVFIAQHATAICCRKCIQKWHGIHKNCTLTEVEINYLLKILEAWLSKFL